MKYRHLFNPIIFLLFLIQCHAFVPMHSRNMICNQRIKELHAKKNKTTKLSPPSRREISHDSDNQYENDENDEEGSNDENFDLSPDFVSMITEEKEYLDSYVKGSMRTTLNKDETDGKLEISIDNEISLMKFIDFVNEKDKGLKMEEEKGAAIDFLKVVEIIITKTLDTFEDLILMSRRNINENKFVPFDVLDEWNDIKLSHKPRLLVVGSGWASHAFIKVVDTDQFRVLNVSPTNYFVFTPMLASSSVGTTEIRSIVESVRDSNPTIRFLEGTGLKIDAEKQQIRVKLGEDTCSMVDPNLIGEADEENQEYSAKIVDLDYDILVYAAGVGPISSSTRTPGLCSKNVHFLKSVNDAKRLRSKVISLLEEASQPNISKEKRRQLLTFVIVGAGPTGVEYTGELNDFLSDVTGFGSATKKDGIRRTVAPFANLFNYTQVILVQGAKDILPQFDEQLRKSARRMLEEEGVQVKTSTRVTKIESNECLVVSAQSKDGDKVDTTIDCGLIVWAGGTKPIRLTEQLISNIDENCHRKYHKESVVSSLSVAGRIPVDKWLRVLGTSGTILAMGDSAVTVGEGTNILPQTAQVAAQQGAYLARLLNRGYNLNGEEKIIKDDNTNIEKQYDQTLFLSAPHNFDAIDGDFITRLQLRGAARAKPFEFLNLGQLAYIGGGHALSQVQFSDKHLFNQAGSVGFLLWRSVYVVKQVSTKTRLLVLFDWFQTKIFGRGVTRM